MTQPPTVTLEQVERVAPYGVLKPYLDSPWVVCRNEIEGAKLTALSPSQIVERLRVVECDECPGSHGVVITGRRRTPAGTVTSARECLTYAECPKCNGSGYLDPDPQLRALFVNRLPLPEGKEGSLKT